MHKNMFILPDAGKNISPKPALSPYFCLVTQMSLQLNGDHTQSHGKFSVLAPAERISLSLESVTRGNQGQSKDLKLADV